MNVLVVKELLLALKLEQVLVKDLRSQEVSSGCTLEGGANLNHPVHHFSSVLLCHFRSFDWTCASELLTIFWRAKTFLKLQILRIFVEFFLLKTFVNIFEIFVIELSFLLHIFSFVSERFDFILFGSFER